MFRPVGTTKSNLCSPHSRYNPISSESVVCSFGSFGQPSVRYAQNKMHHYQRVRKKEAQLWRCERFPGDMREDNGEKWRLRRTKKIY